MLWTIVCVVSTLSAGGHPGPRQVLNFTLTEAQAAELSRELGPKPGTAAFQRIACENLDLVIESGGES